MDSVKVNADGSISVGSFCNYAQGEETRPAPKAEEVKEETKAETTQKKKTTAKSKG